MNDWSGYLAHIRARKGPLADARRTVSPITAYARKVDHEAVQRCRDRKTCELDPLHKGPFHPHHVKTRGSGGADSDENLLCVCWLCHDRIHRGRIPRAVVEQALAERIARETPTGGDNVPPF